MASALALPRRRHVALFDLPSGVNVSNLQMSMTGLSGEDSADLAISWNSGSGDVKAQHIKVALDPTDRHRPRDGLEGAAVTVNADTTGTQDQASSPA